MWGKLRVVDNFKGGYKSQCQSGQKDNKMKDRIKGQQRKRDHRRELLNKRPSEGKKERNSK